MRMLTIIVAMTAALGSLTACTSDPNNPAIKAMSPVNACGPGGTSDINACPNHR